MAVTPWVGGWYRGLSTDTKPDHAGLTNWNFLETDTGNISHHDGTSWKLRITRAQPRFKYTIFIDPDDSETKLRNNINGDIEAESQGSTVEAVLNTGISAGSSAQSIAVSDGTYDVSGSFTGFDTLREYQHIAFSKQALVRVPSGYTGRMWLIDQDTAVNKHGIVFEGGRFEENGSSANWTCFLIDAADNPTQTGEGIGDLTIRDVHIDDVSVGIELKTDDEGWINGNLFENIRIHRPRTGVKFTDVGTSTDFCNRNVFSNVIIQGTGIQDYGFRDINGKDNMFLHCKVWDFASVPTARTVTISSDASYTKIFGGIMRAQNYVDNGTATFVLDEFNDEETGSRYPAGYMEVGGGIATNDITTIGNNDLNFIPNTSDTSFNIAFEPNADANDLAFSWWNKSRNERLMMWRDGTGAGAPRYALQIIKNTAAGSMRTFTIESFDVPGVGIVPYIRFDAPNDELELCPDNNVKLGFFGTTPVDQEPANADTTGASLSTLETEVNELKQLLRNYGLMAT